MLTTRRFIASRVAVLGTLVPTQPIPSRPAPFDRQGFTENTLIDFAPEILAQAKGASNGFRLTDIVAYAHS